METWIRDKDNGYLVAVMADEDTTTGFILAGVGQSQKGKNSNFFVVNSRVSKFEIEEQFRKFVSSDNIGIILITQDVADIIRSLLDDYNQLVPTVLEIPSKDSPYDSSKDTVMNRINKILGKE